MSDDKLHEHAGDEAESPADDASSEHFAKKSGMPPAVPLAFVIIALLGVIIVMLVKSGSFGSSSRDADIAGLEAEVEARRSELSRQRVAMGLSPLEGSSEPIGDIANRLKKDADSLVSLAARFQEMLAEKDNELSGKNAELLSSEKLRRTLFDENSRLRTDLNQALINGGDADRLRGDLAALKAQRDALAAELDAAREQMRTMSAGVSSDEFDDLKRRYDEAVRAKEFFEARVKELEGDLSKAKLFAESENDLLPAAVELFRTLRGLENKPDSDLTTAYSRIGLELGASVLQTVTFATGSSDLTTPNQEMIQALVDELPDGDLLFVVGYASRTGNPESNQTLSSDRATAVAQYYSGFKRPGQQVQAVYLGQTNRFSSRIPERNQICEIWRIRKK